MAVCGVLVVKDDEPSPRRLPGAELPGDRLRQVGLALVGDEVEREVCGHHPGKEAREHLSHRGLLQEEDQLAQRGPAPLKSPCFQSEPARSPAATSRFNRASPWAQRIWVCRPSFATQKSSQP